MRERDRYFKVVEWSEEDQCYIGRCPGLMFGGVHGGNEAEVLQELSDVVDEWIETIRKDGRPLPPATAGKHYSGKFVLRVGEDLHRALAVRALQTGQSLNNYSVNVLLSTIGQESQPRTFDRPPGTPTPGARFKLSGSTRKTKRRPTKHK